TLKHMNFSDKSKVLMVGDSLTSDIQGGINFGIDTCWYNPNKIKNETSIKPTYEISSFDELKSLLINS
ncbi:MAG: HAD hydrolase-like protein, partial [Clostridium perfringens]|nr:HAD hydrolase-like protein [Clostridium perfringens]